MARTKNNHLKKRAHKRHYTKKQKGGDLSLNDYLQKIEFFKLPIIIKELKSPLSTNTEIMISFKHLDDSEEMVEKFIEKNGIALSDIEKLITTNHTSAEYLFDYAIKTSLAKCFGSLEEKMNTLCNFNVEQISELLKNAWDSNLEYAYRNGGQTDASRLLELRKRYIKIQFIDHCNKIIISNNGILFPFSDKNKKDIYDISDIKIRSRSRSRIRSRSRSRSSNKRDKIQIKNYKILGGQNSGLSTINANFNEIGYNLQLKNQGKESMVIIERKPLK